MSEVRHRYQRVAHGFGSRLAQVGAAQWSAPTPCLEWDVRALGTHVIATHGRAVAAVTKAESREVDPDADLLAQWSAATDAVTRLLEDPEGLSAMVSGLFGEQSFESLVSGLLCADTLLHTWDLARATGQDDLLDVDAVAIAMQFLEPLDEALRRPGGFAPKVASPPGADAQTRLLNFGGRAVSWLAPKAPTRKG